jgi:multisubunit Na+/H+ antiporter MnhF subunit
MLALQGAGCSASALEVNGPGQHPAAVEHLPLFITPPGETDVLLAVMAAVLIGAVLATGVFFFWLHSLPERLVHSSTKVHFDIVAALALLSLFTHIHLFWVAALLIALVRIPMPNFSDQLGRIAGSLEKIADGAPRDVEAAPRDDGSVPPGRVNAATRQAHQKSEPPPARRVTHA